jgi:hypothetical protein
MGVKFDHRLTDEQAPHEVSLRRPMDDGDLLAWAHESGTGRCRISEMTSGGVGRPVAYRVHKVRFTDADTAFWFKMRFG